MTVTITSIGMVTDLPTTVDKVTVIITSIGMVTDLPTTVDNASDVIIGVGIPSKQSWKETSFLRHFY